MKVPNVNGNSRPGWCSGQETWGSIKAAHRELLDDKFT
jgi:hypothetical protein